MPKRILIVGAGIKGSILAALLSIAGAEVVLMDRGLIGSGTTSTNHGRLHLGTSSWRTDLDLLIQRRLTASALMRSLPNVISAPEDALYYFETEEDVISFLDTCRRNRIPHCECSLQNLASDWVAADSFQAAVSLPEYSFDPAKVAGRFASLAANHGARLVLQENIKKIHDAGHEHLLHLSDGSKLRADLVVNCGSRWCQDLIVRHAKIDLKVDWYTWRILCARAEGLPRLEQVTVITDAARDTPSAIPHGAWITIDGKSKPELLAPCDEPANYGWHPLDQSSSIECKLYADASRYLTPLKSLDLARIFSFAGVQGRVRGAPPGSTNTVHFGGENQSYAIAFGGQASTAFLDALEITETIDQRGWINSVSRADLVRTVFERLPPDPLPMTSPMIWNRLGS